MPTHYEVLGVAPDADREAVRRAYLDLAKANHPDRRQVDDPQLRARAEHRMRQANEAWNVLRDPRRRAEYDRSLRDPTAAPTGRMTTTTTGPRRPAPPSGIVVPASQASLWRFAPVAVLLLILGIIFVVTAYATAGRDTTGPTSTATRPEVPSIGECVLGVPSDAGVVPVRVACGTQGALRVSSTVVTPRPCPTGTAPLPSADDETTLCVVAAR